MVPRLNSIEARHQPGGGSLHMAASMSQKKLAALTGLNWRARENLSLYLDGELSKDRIANSLGYRVEGGLRFRW